MAKSSKKAEIAKPISEESVTASEGVETTDAMVPGDEGDAGSDVQPDAAEEPFNAVRAMEGKAGAALHAVHMRLIEMLPFLNDAAAQADGELRQFLAELHADLTR